MVCSFGRTALAELIFLKIVTSLLQKLRCLVLPINRKLVIEFGDMTKLLMVCMGNICRSRMAQSVARKLAADAGISQLVTFDSAGTHAHRLGESPDARVARTLLRHGYQVDCSRSRRITAADFQNFDLILAMDDSNLADLQRLCPPEHASKLQLFLDFAEGLGETEIPDPYYGNADGFDRVLDLCEAGARGLISHYTL